MSEETKETDLTPLDDNMFDGAYLTALVLKHKYIVIVSAALAAIISIIVALQMPNYYAGKVNAIPPQNSATGIETALGGISSALKDIGLSKVGGGGESQGYTLKVLLDSRALKDTLIKKYGFLKIYSENKGFFASLFSDSKKDKIIYSEILDEFNSNLDIAVGKEGNYVISFEDVDSVRAAAVANDYIYYFNLLSEKVYRSEQSVNRAYMESRLQSIDSTINDLSAKLSALSGDKLMFSPQEQAKVAAASLSELKSQIYKSDIEYELYKRNYGEMDPGTITKKEIHDRAAKYYDDAINKPGFVGDFNLKNSAGVGMNFIKLYTEIEALSKAKAFVVPSLEKIKLDEKKQIQNLIILDKASVPDKKSRPKRSVIVLGATFGVALLSIFFIILYYAFVSFSRNYKNKVKSIKK